MGVGAAGGLSWGAVKSSVSLSAIGQEFQAVRNLAKKVADGQQYKGKTMDRVKDGLKVALSGVSLLADVAVTGVKWAGGQINDLAKKKPVLAMSLGVSGVILGAALASVEPFTGTALIATSVYAMARGIKEAVERFPKAVTSGPEPKQLADKSFDQDSNPTGQETSTSAHNTTTESVHPNTTVDHSETKKD
jgi:hypothetical protein